MQLRNFKVDENLKELTKHQTIDLPIACYKTTIIQNIHGYTPLHWHDEIQFIRIINGIATFQINENIVELQKGSGIFINSSVLHMAQDLNLTGCTYICLNISSQFLLTQELYSSYVYPYINSPNISYIYLDPKNDWGKTILEEIFNVYKNISKKPLFFEIEISISISKMWKALITNGFISVNEKLGNPYSYRMKLMASWIHLNYDQKIMLEDIAKAGHLSRSECCRYFKKFLNISPLNYVINYRIEKSLLLLQQPETNITEVAFMVGFNSTSYYINKFRKIMNTTPLEYKKTKTIKNKIK